MTTDTITPTTTLIPEPGSICWVTTKRITPGDLVSLVGRKGNTAGTWLMLTAKTGHPGSVTLTFADGTSTSAGYATKYWRATPTLAAQQAQAAAELVELDTAAADALAHIDQVLAEGERAAEERALLATAHGDAIPGADLPEARLTAQERADAARLKEEAHRAEVLAGPMPKARNADEIMADRRADAKARTQAKAKAKRAAARPEGSKTLQAVERDYTPFDGATVRFAYNGTEYTGTMVSADGQGNVSHLQNGELVVASLSTARKAMTGVTYEVNGPRKWYLAEDTAGFKAGTAIGVAALPRVF